MRESTIEGILRGRAPRLGGNDLAPARDALAAGNCNKGLSMEKWLILICAASVIALAGCGYDLSTPEGRAGGLQDVQPCVHRRGHQGSAERP